MIKIQKVKIYSDGSARGNPVGPGGYGTIVKYINPKGKIIKIEEFCKGYPVTSNNKMELLGAIIGLESLNEPCEVEIISDSSYLVNAFNLKWMDNWIRNGWKTSSGKDVKNQELWRRMLSAKSPHKCTFVWVKGHNGHPENERCDFLATCSADGKKMEKIDGIYQVSS